MYTFSSSWNQAFGIRTHLSSRGTKYWVVRRNSVTLTSPEFNTQTFPARITPSLLTISSFTLANFQNIRGAESFFNTMMSPTAIMSLSRRWSTCGVSRRLFGLMVNERLISTDNVELSITGSWNLSTIHELRSHFLLNFWGSQNVLVHSWRS